MNRYATTTKNIRPNGTLYGVQSVQLYLSYCRNQNVNLNSTIFKGTLYELSAKAFLEQWLHCKDVIKVGGSYDYGIDLRGKWNLREYWNRVAVNNPRELKSFGQLLKASDAYKTDVGSTSNKLSLKNDINILVQCKNYDQKVKASVIRELIGIYHFHINKKKDFVLNYIFLISLHNLTKQAQLEIDKIDIPVVHCKLKPLHFIGGDVYDITNWTGSDLDSIYLNKLSRKFLTGLSLEIQFKLITLGNQ